MCNWINIKWNECGLVIVRNDLENTSISMVAQCSVQLSGGAGAVAVVVGERVVVAGSESGGSFFFCFLLSYVE
jgi:hypothetical protein